MLDRIRRTLSNLTINLSALGLIVSAMGIATISSNASALESNPTESKHTHESPSNMNHEHKSRPDVATTTTERRTAASEQLSAAKLKVCEKREASVNTRTDRIAERANKQLRVFTKISERVQAFYVTKGYTIDNYDTLVEEVDAAKTTAETTVAEISVNKASFNCEDSPKRSLETFKETLKANSAALRDYRTSIRNLIVAMKSANNVDKQSDSSSQKTAGETE